MTPPKKTAATATKKATPKKKATPTKATPKTTKAKSLAPKAPAHKVAPKKTASKKTATVKKIPLNLGRSKKVFASFHQASLSLLNIWEQSFRLFPKIIVRCLLLSVFGVVSLVLVAGVIDYILATLILDWRTTRYTVLILIILAWLIALKGAVLVLIKSEANQKKLTTKDWLAQSASFFPRLLGGLGLVSLYSFWPWIFIVGLSYFIENYYTDGLTQTWFFAFVSGSIILVLLWIMYRYLRVCLASVVLLDDPKLPVLSSLKVSREFSGMALGTLFLVMVSIFLLLQAFQSASSWMMHIWPDSQLVLSTFAFQWMLWGVVVFPLILSFVYYFYFSLKNVQKTRSV